MYNNLLLFKGYIISEEKIDSGDFKKLSIDKEVSFESIDENDASCLVENTHIHNKLGVKCYKYKSYTDGNLGFPTAKESLESLIYSLIKCDKYHIYKLNKLK